MAALTLAGYECIRLVNTSLVLPLALAYRCGQAFRWRQVRVRSDPHGPFYTEWSLCIHNRVVFLVHDVDQHCLYYRTVLAPGTSDIPDTKAWIWDYLNLDAPISKWYDEWCQRDPIFAKHAKRFAGVSILRQDPWECMCASNNNIPRISQMVHKLSDHFTEPILDQTYPPGSYLCTSMNPEDDRPPDDSTEPLHVRYHPFPTPSQLAEPGVEQKLRNLGFGYRAKYLAGTAQSLCALAAKSLATDDIKPTLVDQAVYDYLLSLRSKTYADARQVLVQLPGVGPKVAEYVLFTHDSCILLMSLDQYSSIPVDRHVFQFAERWYRIRSKKYEDIADRLREIWGERAGWAHTVLFYADLPSFDRYDGTHIQSGKATDILSYKRERSPQDALAAPTRDVKPRVPHRS